MYKLVLVIVMLLVFSLPVLGMGETPPKNESNESTPAEEIITMDDLQDTLIASEEVATEEDESSDSSQEEIPQQEDYEVY